jgi:hypothetical protein
MRGFIMTIRGKNRLSEEMAQRFYNTNPPQSSIGPRGYVGPAGYGRLKGFLNLRVDNEERAEMLVGIVEHGVRMVEKDGQWSRLSIRVPVNREVMEYLRKELRGVGASIEAELTMRIQGRDYVVPYIGYSTEERRLTPAVQETFEQSVRSAYAKAEREALQELLIGAMRKGYSAKVFGGAGKAERVGGLGLVTASGERVGMEHMVSLMSSTYGYPEADARSSIANQENLLAILHRGRELAGMALVERETIGTGRGAIRIAEFTDIIVLSEHRGNRLSVMLTAARLLHIGSEPEGCCIYAEANLSTPIPRTLALYGGHFAGILPNHAEISGEMRSLAVMQLNRREGVARLDGLKHLVGLGRGLDGD